MVRSLVGGDLTIAGTPALTAKGIPTLGAPGGRLHLASVASAGEVLFPAAESSSGLDIGSLPQLGTIDVRPFTLLDASGNGGGAVVIRSGRLLVDNASLFANTLGHGESAKLGMDIAVRGEIGMTQGSVITADTLGAGAAGDIRLVAGSLRMEGSILSSESSRESKGGDIVVEATQVALTAGAQISSSTRGSGQGGTVRITASDTVSLAGTDPTVTRPSGIFAQAAGMDPGAGSAGNVSIEAPRVSLTAGAQINTGTEGPGQGGTVRIAASDTVSLSDTNLDGTRVISGIYTVARGSSGSVTIEAPRVTLTGGQILTATVAPERLEREGPGRGGSVRITASDTVSLSGTNPSGTRHSAIVTSAFGIDTVGSAGSVSIEAPRVSLTAGGQISAETSSQGRGGDIVVQAGSLDLTGGAQISSSSGTVVGSIMPSFRVGAGAGGTVTVTATGPVHLHGRDSGLFTRTAGAGRGGDITLRAPSVDLTDGAIISAESTGTGNAGSVTITTQDSFLSTHGSVATRATQADGGTIQITAANFLRLRDSAISAEVGGGASMVGGNITIDPQFIVLQNSQISANAFAGRGGNIRLQAQQVFLADPASTVSASSSLGINGQVDIQSPVKSITEAVAPLPQAFARTTELLRNRCAERVRTGTTSRFVLGGRDGVPLEPGNWLPSALEPLDQQPPPRSAQTPQARRRDHRRDVRIDNPGQARVKGQYAQIQWPDLDVECARWLGQQRTR